MKVEILIALVFLFFLFIEIKERSAVLLYNNCGSTKESNGVFFRISGGRNTTILEHPWMVLVIGEQNCGGTVITSRYVLTAAHCIFDSDMMVRFGHDRTPNCRSSNKCTQTPYQVGVDQKIVHRNFNDYQNDIGLLRMEIEVEFSDYVMPICLVVNEEMEPIQQFSVTGWGKTEDGHLSRVLKTASLHYLNPSICSEKIWETLDQSQICAGSNSSDSCGGDSGGPLDAKIYYNGKYLTAQFGIVSSGLPNCAGIGIYTNVTHYMEWIVTAVQYFKKMGSMNIATL